MPAKILRKFFKLEADDRILLGFAAILALVMENSPLRYLYDAFLITPVAVQIGAFIIYKPLLLWINEIKREVLEGQLSSKEQVILFPLVGITAPAFIYGYINRGDVEAISWWAISATIDIAFALCIITLLDNRVPKTLKICLVAIAIAILAILNRKGVIRLAPYILVGIVLWACVLKSAVHAMLAGVVIAMFIQLEGKNKLGSYPVLSLEHGLNTRIAYAIRVFALLLMPEFCLLGYRWRF